VSAPTRTRRVNGHPPTAEDVMAAAGALAEAQAALDVAQAALEAAVVGYRATTDDRGRRPSLALIGDLTGYSNHGILKMLRRHGAA
jgi:hypothetical protein